jgi:2-oxoglutarate dehydrogenase E1 component
MADFPEHAQLANLKFIEDLYGRYLADPASVDPSWRHFFEGIDFAAYLNRPEGEAAPKEVGWGKIWVLVDAYRRLGHLGAEDNPIEERGEPPELNLSRFGFSETDLDKEFPTLGTLAAPKASLREILANLKAIYANRIGFEFMEADPKVAEWMINRLEKEPLPAASIEEKQLILDALNRSEVLETFLHTKYVGQTRFSLEGGETLIPMLIELLDVGSELGLQECFIGMAHRGRLNVLANVLNKPFSTLFEEFEDDTSLSFIGSDDVKYHLGFTSERTTRFGKKILLSLSANPSHLEAVDPVTLGQTRARQIQMGEDPTKALSILIHGDASLAGQGIIYECFQLMKLPAYSVGGAIHIVVNNQIGYTTLPSEGRSTRYCSDIAKTFSLPVFHVSAEDPEGCIFAAKLASEIRQTFGLDVVIDLLCYRKFGHNEGDEPAYTQPLQYKLIRSKKSIREIYASQLEGNGEVVGSAEFKERLSAALKEAQENPKTEEPTIPPFDPFALFQSGANLEACKKALQTYCSVPADFHLQPKLQKWVQDRLHISQQDPAEAGVDWSSAECLAFGTLLQEGVSIRLSGQDSQRGTFSQRHMIWSDTETGAAYSPLSPLEKGGARFDVINSPLSEYGCMGFEYGYSLNAPNTLVLWEAQYGDFWNGAEIMVDQFIVCGEPKWNTPSSLTLLLPHAYEGAGPEHSSARVERFLQMASQNNIQVCTPSTSAQYFHLLRRQALRKVKKPLIILTPKGLLRSSALSSPLAAFLKGSFSEVLSDPRPPASAKKVLLCSGKIYSDLVAAREKIPDCKVALIRIEQYYPLHLEALKKAIQPYAALSQIAWVQEEPENMGAWNFLRSSLEKEIPKLQCISRKSSPTTATGSHKKHKQEQQELIQGALTC